MEVDPDADIGRHAFLEARAQQGHAQSKPLGMTELQAEGERLLLIAGFSGLDFADEEKMFR